MNPNSDPLNLLDLDSLRLRLARARREAQIIADFLGLLAGPGLPEERAEGGGQKAEDPKKNGPLRTPLEFLTAALASLRGSSFTRGELRAKARHLGASVQDVSNAHHFIEVRRKAGELERLPEGRYAHRASVPPAPSLPGPPGKFKLAAAMRQAIALRSGPFSRQDLAATLAAEYPERAGQLSALAVNLLDFVERGELTRTGQRTDAIYRRAEQGKQRTEDRGPKAEKPEWAATAATPAERNYQQIRQSIHVPRDLEPEGEAS